MTESTSRDKNNFSAYCGYHQTREGASNEILVRTDPGTPCGEYLRRYWHPVHIASELGDRPRLIKILGEELVLFRDQSDQYGQRRSEK